MPKLTREEKRRARNKAIKSAIKTYIKKAEELISKGEREEAEKAVIQAISALDRAVSKGVIHHNNASRRKSRLMSKFNKVFLKAKA